MPSWSVSLSIYLLKKNIADTLTDTSCWVDFPGISVRRIWECNKRLYSKTGKTGGSTVIQKGVCYFSPLLCFILSASLIPFFIKWPQILFWMGNLAWKPGPEPTLQGVTWPHIKCTPVRAENLEVSRPATWILYWVGRAFVSLWCFSFLSYCQFEVSQILRLNLSQVHSPCNFYCEVYMHLYRSQV